MSVAHAQAPVPPKPIETLPAAQPAWLPGYRVRYVVRVAGDLTLQATQQSVMVRVPTAGWVKPDASDITAQNAAGAEIPVAVLSHDPAGDTIIQFKRNASDRYYWVYASNAAAVPNPAAPTAETFKEGVVAEYREWAGENLANWVSVAEGLKKSELVIGNAPVAEVIQNSNPMRPSNPRNFAASYRGYFNAPVAGEYKFFVNSEDASFLFIDGVMVCERGGENARVTGRFPLADFGQKHTLTAGVHSFEVHHVMGNNPTTYGFCMFTWLTPGSKNWDWVKREAIPAPLYGTVADIQESASGQAAQFNFGIDDALKSSGTAIYLTRFEACGAVKDPNQLQWDFGDGTTGVGRSVSHIYFKEGVFKVTLKSGALPPVSRAVWVWAAPNATSPLALKNAVSSIAAMNWTQLDPQRINQVFEFLLLCEQPERWPVLEAVAKHLLARQGVDPEIRALAYTSQFEAMASQGKGTEALKLVDAALKEFEKIPSLQVGIKLGAAWINHRHLKNFDDAAKIYQDIIETHRRLDVPEVRLAAIRLGDLYTESGELSRAGEVYRLANTLGGSSFQSAAGDAVTRGAMLRVAEQKLRAGDVRQCRKLLETIEVKYPEQKLEGLYRFLRAEADRLGGRYEDAIRGYQVLMNLTAWAGFHDKATYGAADSYYRMGEYQKSLDWLSVLQERYPAFYDAQKLGLYQRAVEGRLARTRNTDPAKNAMPGGLFAGQSLTFEPDDKTPLGDIVGWIIAPSLGMVGTNVGLIESVPPPNKVNSDYNHRLRNITSNGYYWVEYWYRETAETFFTSQQIAIVLYGTGADYDPAGSQTLGFERTYGQWRKIGFLLKAPVTQDGRLNMSIRLVVGVLEIDGLAIMPVSDRQVDAMANFVEGGEAK